MKCFLDYTVMFRPETIAISLKFFVKLVKVGAKRDRPLFLDMNQLLCAGRSRIPYQ